MSLTTKHTFTLSHVCLSTKETFALLRSTGKLSGRVLFVLFLFLSHYVFSQNPIAGNQGFQILSEGNFTSTNSYHIHGPLAVGGNLIINTPYTGEINMDHTGSYVFSGDGSVPTGLLVKGSVTWTTGAVKVNDGNYIHIGNSTGSITSNNGGTGLTQVLPTGTSYNNAKRIEASVIQPTNVFQTVGFDFTTLFNTYRSTSTTLSGRTNNVQLYNSSNVAISGNTVSSAQNVKINSLNPGVNYLNLTSTSLNNITELSFATAAVPSASKVLVINVPITANFVWNNSNMAGIAGTQGPYVLWNFYGGTTYNLTLNTASMVVGTIFAPNMNLIKTGTGDTEGGIIAKTVQLGMGEIHNFQFDSDLSTSDPCTCTGNLLTNNSFENGITGWSSSGGSAYNGTGYQVCGSYNGYLQATTTNAWLWQQVSATVGTTYNLSFWGGTHDPSFNHYVRLAYYNSSNTLIGSNQVNIDYDVDPNNDLAYYLLSGTAPAGTSYMRVEVFANGDYVKLDQMCLSNAATSGLTTCTSPVVTASSNSPVNAGSSINLTSSSMGGNGAQLVTNGDFGSGNNSFSSDYTFGGGYNITTNPQTVWNWAVNCTNANGNMIVGDGNGNANSRFWYQSINVTAGTTYTLSFNAYDFWGGTTAAKLQWGVNGTKTGTISNLSTGGCNTWQQISTTWTATTTGTAVFAIYNNEVSAGSNDFAIDDISIKASGPTTYSWSGPLSFTSTSQNPTISSATTSMSGVYTVTSSVGGCTATATTNVTVSSTFSCAGSCESANLVVNPQFEIDMSGWTASNGQLTRGGGGTYGSFLEVNVGDLTGTYTAYQDVTFGANAPYKFIAYAAKHGVNNLPKMYLEFYNGTTYLSKTADILVSKNYDGTFQTINFEGNTPANTTKIRIVGWTQNNALKFDNISLVGCQACLTITSPASICVGQSATLTANNCSGTITWNTGATGSTITVNPTTTTTYTATCNNTTNVLNNPSFETGNLTAWTNWNYTTITSTASEKYSGTYGAKVTASAAGGGFAQDNVAVAGESFTMKVWGKVSSATPWSGVGVKFMNSSWTSLADVSTEINATSFQEYTVVTNTAPAGTAWVQVYAWTDASTILYLDNFSLVKTSSNTSATATVTVNTAPTATATGDTECVGATITLGSTGGGTYSWAGPASFASTLQNPTRPSATASMAGVYTVTVTSANGCTATATANVVINNGTIPTATVGNTGCTGSTGSITVTNLPDGYSTNINGGAWTQYKNSYVDLAAGTYSIGYQGGGCNTYANFTVATSTDNPLVSLSKIDPTCTTTGSVTVTGSGGTTGLGDATYQLWYGISGSLVSNLTSNANYPNTPSLSTLVGITEGYNNAMDNIGGRISGYIVPPTTGTYYFWVASDDYSEFWGSGDSNPANKILLASVAGYTGYREWNKYTSQKTAAINLTAGQIYYFEVLYKEGTGGDNISLGWAKPGEAITAPSEVIPGKYLRPNVASSTTTPVYQYKIGGGAFQTGNVFTGLAAGTYTVTIQDAGGCTTTASITLSVSGGTTAPTGIGASRCGTGTVAISASGCTGTYNWYAAAAGGTSLGTGATYTTPSISASTTYYVDCTVSTCVSSRTAVTATVTAIPSAPTATGASRCGTGTVTLSASGCTGTYNWYAAPTGGTSLGSAATYTTSSISASTTYYVDCTVSGCASSRASAVATINAQPANPTGSGSRCGTGTVVLTGSGCTGTYNWYAASTGGTSLGSNSTYTTPSISTTTTYYLSCTIGSCVSSIVPAVATVNAIPTATASSNSPIVVGGTLNLFSTGGTTYSWVGPNGFTSNQQDVSSANLAALDAGIYTVTVNTGGCTATATTQVVLNNYDPGDIDCSLVSSLTFSNPTLISGTAGANNAQYRFSNVAAGTDAIVTILSRSHTDVEIVDLDIPAATYGGYDAAFQPMIDYNWINGGGSFDAAGEKSITFKFDFVQSGTTTPKTIPNLLATGLDIDGSTNEVREFIQASNYQSYQIQTPSSLTLSGALKAKGPLTTYAGINEFALDAMVSYAYINSSSITVTYGGDWNGSTADFGDTAPGNSDEKRLNSLYFKCYNFNTTVCALPLTAPTGTGATRCGTGSVTLSASGCTGTYYWYTASTGGLAVEVGSTFATPSLSSNTTYYVECNAAGCTSTRTAVVATIKPAVSISKVLGDSECLGNTIDLSVTPTGGTNFTYSWSGPSSFVSTLQNPTRTSATAAMAGTYSVIVSNAEGCISTATTTVTVSSLPTASIAGTTTICNGQSTTLTVSGGNYYIWSNGSTSAAITVNPSATTSYSVTVYQNNVTNTSLITNVTSFNASNFSLINATNSYGVPATLFDGVDNLNAETFHATRTTAGADWGVGYNLGGSVLVTNLSIDRRNDCCTDRAEGGVMQVWNNGTMVYQSNVLNNTGDGVLAATPAPNVIGTEVRYVFLAGANTVSGESLLNFTELIIGGTKLCSTTSTATVTVNAIPTAPTSAGASRCGTGTVTLSASGCAGTNNWYNVASGGTSLSTASTYTTPSVSATTTYYVDCTVGSCTSSRTASVATVNAVVTATASSNAPVCVGSAINLSATGGTSYLWNGPNSFTSTAQNPSFVASATTSGIYTVTVTGVGGCTATTTTNVANPNITISNIVVSACINQPLQDVATVSMSIAWVNAPSGDKIKVVINNKTEYIDVAAGATSPQAVTFIVPANGIANIPISASWVTYQSGNCNTLASFNAPVACSVENLNCEKILYLCGPDKPADGDAWDHGFMNYLTGQGATVTATYTKPDASGYGLYNPLSITTLMNINLNDYTSIIISPTTEANLAANLLTALKGYSGGILMMNYTEADDLGLTSTPASYNWQDNAYTNNTNSIKIYNYDNINPTYGNVVTFGNYLATADAYLWAGANNMSSATNSIYFYYTPTDAMAGVPATHGARVYLGYHMNGVYSNAQNGGAMPAPSNSYFSPTNHLTLEGKAYFDQAIKNITTGLSVQATGDTKCAGSTISLTSTGVGIVSYSWAGPSSFTSTLQNPTRSSTTTAMSGIYTVTVTGAGGCTATATANVVINAIPSSPTSAGGNRCSTGTVTMTASGCAGGTISWYGALTGGTALSTGTTYTTPSISATTTYYLECSLNGCVSTTRNSAVATVNSILTATATGDTKCVGTTVNLASSGGNTYSWAGPSGFTSTLQNPTISNAQTTNAGVYTVAVTSAAGCSATATANVVVNAIPSAPTSAGGNRCGTGTITMTASGCAGGTISWYGALTGGTALSTGATYTTPSISATTTYYLECSLNGCVSTTRNSAVATVNSIPTATATGDTKCVGATVNLASSGGNTYSWAGPSGFTSTLQNPTISNAQTTNAGVYTVTVTSAAGCIATATANVVVNTIPTAPTSAGGNRCGTGTIIMTASGCAGGTISWYGALTGGTALSTGATYTTPSISATTTYYLECSLNTCISTTRNSAVATVNNIPTATATGDTECLGATIVISASGGNSYLWTGPNSFNSTSATPSIANAQLSHAGIYTVTVTGTGGCTASATTTVVVSSVAAPTTTGASLCGSGAVAISASGCTGIYNWYSAALGGTSIGSGDSYITPVISSSTTYYVDCTVDGCVSPRASVTASILATTTAAASSNSPYISGGTLNLYGSGAGTYAWSGPNGFSSNQQNPVITNAGTDKVGTYTFTVTAANGCKAVATIYATTTSGTGIDGNAACNDPIVAGSTKINPSRTGICIGCSVTGASTVVNGNLGDYAEMTIGASIIGGGVAISVQDTLIDYPAGNYAGFTVQPVGNILSASILSGITINTYSNGVLQETATSANGLLKLSIISGYGSLQRVGLLTTKNYDEIQIIANGGLVSLLTGLRVFYAFEEPISCDKDCEQPISSTSFGGSVVSSRSGISGLLCLGSVSNTANVLDADSTNFASMSLAIGALCQSALSVKANTSFVAGTHAGYVVANASGILSLDILGNIRIETYLNGVIRESINANSSVISVGLFNPTTNQTAISFKSNLSFDEVRIVVAGTVSLLTQLNVYYPFIRRDADGDGVPDCLDKCPNGSDLFDSNGDGVPDACTPDFPTVTIGGDTVCVGQTIYLTSNATQTELLEDNKVCNDAIVGTGVRLNPSLTGICLGCGVGSGAALIDGDLTNYSELAIGVSIIGGGTALSVQDTMRRYPSGNYAGFVVQPVGGLLDVSVLSSITIKTYLNGVLQESATIGNSLLGVSVLSGNGGLQKVGFVTTKTYDEIQIIAGGGLASLLTALRVYYAFEEPSSCWKNCEEAMKVSNFGASVVSARTGVSGLLCLGSVSNSSRLIDSDTTNYATMNLAIGLVCQTAVSVKGNTTLPAGTHAGFVVENSGGLLSLLMLGNIKIETYLAGSLRESVTLNSNLVTVGLLNPNSPQTRLSIKTGQSFDEVRLVVYGTISLLSQLNVYYSFIRRDADSDGIPNCMDKCTGSDLTDTDGDGTPDACDGTNTTLLTYSWTGPGGFTSNLQSPTRPSATTAMGGIYTLTITNSSGYVRTLTTNVIVSAYPVISATPSSVCAGGTISMTVSGAITYTWTGPGGFTSNEIIITRANATTAMAGTYTIVASNYSTCNSTGTVAVTVNALPTAPVVANAARCDVGAITITATGCSGGTIQWYASQTGTTMLASGASYSIASLSNSAVYFTSCTDANACVSSSRSYGVAAINPIPDATLTGIGSLCLGYQPTNSGKLLLTKFKTIDTFSYNIGSTYNSGTASAFAAIPTNGEVLTGIADPSTTITYTVRIKNAENCIIDRVVTLTNQCSTCPAGYCEPSSVVKTK